MYKSRDQWVPVVAGAKIARKQTRPFPAILRQTTALLRKNESRATRLDLPGYTVISY